MSSFYARANVFERALIRMIEGSLRSALHDHPEISIIDPPRFVRSMTKRIASRIAANWGRLCEVRTHPLMRPAILASHGDPAVGHISPSQDGAMDIGGEPSGSPIQYEIGLPSGPGSSKPGPLAGSSRSLGAGAGRPARTRPKTRFEDMNPQRQRRQVRSRRDLSKRFDRAVGLLARQTRQAMKINPEAAPDLRIRLRALEDVFRLVGGDDPTHRFVLPPIEAPSLDLIIDTAEASR